MLVIHRFWVQSGKASNFLTSETMEASLLPQTLLIHNTQRSFHSDFYLQLSIPSRRCQFLKCQVLKSEEMALTHQVFDKMPSSDAFAWNTLIRFHLDGGELEHVVSIYEQMLSRGVRPDKHTLPRVLAASRLLKSLSFGKQLHGHAVKLGLSSKDYVITSLMELYGQLDSLSAVKPLFHKPELQKSCVPWTLLIRLHMRHGSPRSAIDKFHQMVGLGVPVDTLALMAAIGACDMLESLQEGKKVHGVAQACGLDSDVLVSNSLLKMYLDCGSVKHAREVFNKMPAKDVISWTEMIRGYVKNGGFNEGLKLFIRMLVDGVRPDHLAISSILPACARMTAHKQGKQIHGFLLRNNFEINLTLKNALMDMYIKSGFLDSASKIFAQMTYKDAVSWTIMVQGYSLHGRGARGVELFSEMLEKGDIEIDEGAYLSVIHACKSAGMVEEGKRFFSYIKAPEVRHYALMVSLLVRSGLFDEANDFVEEKQIAKNAEVAKALSDGYRIHRDQIAMSSQYLSPKKAYSWIEFRNKVHVFGTGDSSHPRSEEIYLELQSLMRKVAGFGFHDVDEERDCAAMEHSEMLAICFGLISSRVSTIRITKNIDICQKCHEMAKAVSKVMGREIIIRDPNCFHHFRDGLCSCDAL